VTATEPGARVALVTGAAQGLGFGIASAFAAAGYHVAIFDVAETDLDKASDALRARGAPRALALRTDVTDRAQVDAAIARVAAELGSLHVLVNNAQQTRHQSVLDTTDAALDSVWRSGYVGSLYCMQAAFPHLQATKGCVINLASGAGLQPRVGGAAYASTKEAIRALTRVAALEWGHQGVRVVSISPSAHTDALDRWAQEFPEEYAVRTAQIPLERFGDPELDVGRVAVFLASPEASYITGTTIVVDGGAYHLG
jgi:NAD(P)-dependent dehydrogenase (short-subunit alcohol dehydrogenase family)